MPLPEITHLQYLILCTLIDQEKAGREIRTLLDEHGEKKSGPAFYQMMSRLEEAGYAKGRYTQKLIDGQLIKERLYAITGEGIRVWDQTRAFYLNTSNLGPAFGSA